MKPKILIHEFLEQRRFAVVGVSRTPTEFSRRLFRELLNRGYGAVPVNPLTPECDGNICFPRVQDIRPPVTSALILTSPNRLNEILKDCAEAGITLVWIYGITGESEIPKDSLALCEKHGIEVVPGYCPYMFMPATALLHRVHGFIARTVGAYPEGPKQ